MSRELDVADLADYRFALKTMPDERLVTELVCAHDNLMKAGDEDRPFELAQFQHAKAEVLARMNYEKGVKK